MDKEKQLQKLREQKRKYKKSRKKIEVLYRLEEYEFLKGQGRKLGCSTTAYVKGCSLKNTRILEREPKTDQETIAQIKKIGVNVNQIAKQVNAAKDSLPNYEQIQKVLSKYVDDLHQIIGNIKAK